MLKELKKVVVKLSGSLVSPPRTYYLSSLNEVIVKLTKEISQIGVVVGGGPLARDYIKPLRELEVPEAVLDIIGIEAARLNALLLASILYPLSPLRVPRSIEEALDVLSDKKIVVMGGLQPGQSTNAVAASLAEAIKADILINLLSDIDGIYSPAPGVPGAKRLERLSCEEFYELVKELSQKAGSYELFDHTAIQIIRRSRIPVYFAHGQDPNIIIDIIKGRAEGTLVYC